MVNTSNFKGAITRDVLQKVIVVQAAASTPLLAMLLGNNRILDAKSQKVEWYTTEAGSRRTQINNGPDDYDENTTSIVVDDGTVALPNDQIIFEATGELGIVTAVSGNTWTVIRGIGSVSAAAGSVADDEYIMNIGNASGEGADAPADSEASKTPEYNILQTFRRSVQISGRQDRIETLTEDELAFQRARAFDLINHDQEHALLFGARNDNAGNDADGNKITTMGGLREMVTTNVSNIGGTMSQSEFDAFAESVFDSGSTEKDLYAGSKLIQAITDLHRDQRRIADPVANVGLRVVTIETPFGRLRLHHHPLFRGAFTGDGIAADINDLKLRPTAKNGGGRLQLKKDTQDKGKDAKREEYFAEHTLDFGAEQNHAQIRGVTGADLT